MVVKEKIAQMEKQRSRSNPEILEKGGKEETRPRPPAEKKKKEEVRARP